MKPSKELVKAAENVFLAMAQTQTVRAIIEPIQIKILTNGQYKSKYGTRAVIVRAFDSYQMSDEDFSDYSAKLHAEYLANGFEVEMNICPLLVAEDLERKAKRLLVEKSFEIMPSKIMTLERIMTAKLELYHQYIDITLKYLARFVDKDIAKHSLQLC